ncbi:MAG: glycosyltransferase family 39 protein [Chloroflexi bacterium]|nr:glycosyltransferase family 39 protein [Chloroflexota bacterium]
MSRVQRWAQGPGGQAFVDRVQAIAPQLVLAAILLLTFAVYAPTLTFWFMHDDFLFLRAAQTASNPWVYVRDSFDFRNPGPPADFSFYRPLYQASFLGFYKLFGLEAWAYHLLNVSVHLANVAFVWLIARKLTGRVLVAHGAALIFALHPAYTSAVAWVAAGNAVLETLPYLASLWFFLKHLDGGPGRLWYYGGSLAAFVLALLFHPEALVLTVLIVLAYGLLYARGTRDLLAVRPWLRLVPFVVTAFAYFQIQSWVRDHSIIQAVSFGFGPWFDDNYRHYMSFVLYPFGLTTSSTYTARHLIATIGFLLISLTVGVAGPRRGRATTFVLYWFYLSLIPLSTFIFGADARKLYTAGPALAILLAMFGVILWDARPRRLGAWATGLAVALVIALTAGTAWRALETQEPVGSSARDGRQLLDQVREEYPTLPSDGRLVLVDVPWTLVLFGDTRLRDAFRIYYGDIEVRGFKSEEAFLDAKLEISEDDVIFRYSDPPDSR